MKIDFEKPPINEVSIGMQFALLPNLRSEHIGLFWNRVRAAFPNSQQNIPLGALAQVPSETFPMPRFWFIGKDDATLIQVHRNAFLFNWRLRAEEYPRFERVFEAFRKHRSTFIQFLKEDLNTTKIEQAKYQLTYVNLFEGVPYWSGPEDTPKIVPSFAFVNPGLKSAKPKDFTSTTIFQVEDDLSLSVAARNGLNNVTGKMVLVLELEASGTHPRVEAEKADGWYQRAHTAISESFVALTDPQIQEQYWIPK
jgi:uncharacterized protein (TIGR04255 family)